MNSRKRKSIDSQKEKSAKIVRVDSGYDSESLTETDTSEDETKVETDIDKDKRDNKEDKNDSVFQIESEKITTAEQWKNLTNHVVSDNHETTHRAQLRYIPDDSNTKPNSFLMVDDNGIISTNGNQNDNRTLFDIIHNYMNDKYRLICKGGPCKDYILYMDYDQLKAKKMKPRELYPDESTLFSFTSKDNRQIPPWKVSSFSGIPLQFGNNGQFINTPHKLNHKDLYSFYAYVAHTMRISAV